MNRNAVVVRPIRFTDRLPQMRAFLETLGLRARVESERGGWVDMVAGAGMVALHTAATSNTGARDGETRLSFEVRDLDVLADWLRRAGFTDATVWDEAYGRVLSVTDPLGDPIWVDGYNDDDYGFRVYEPERDARLSVMPIRFFEQVDRMTDFFEALGLTARLADHGVNVYGGHTGLVCVHSPIPEGDSTGPRAVQLGFETREPLPELADRLIRAGHQDTAIGSGDLWVTDPDDQAVVVRPSPSRFA